MIFANSNTRNFLFDLFCLGIKRKGFTPAIKSIIGILFHFEGEVRLYIIFELSDNNLSYRK